MIIRFKDIAGFISIENLIFLEKVVKQKSNLNGSIYYTLNFIRNPTSKFDDKIQYRQIDVSEDTINEIIEKSGFVCESE